MWDLELQQRTSLSEKKTNKQKKLTKRQMKSYNVYVVVQIFSLV